MIKKILAKVIIYTNINNFSMGLTTAIPGSKPRHSLDFNIVNSIPHYFNLTFVSVSFGKHSKMYYIATVYINNSKSKRTRKGGIGNEKILFCRYPSLYVCSISHT